MPNACAIILNGAIVECSSNSLKMSDGEEVFIYVMYTIVGALRQGPVKIVLYFMSLEVFT